MTAVRTAPAPTRANPIPGSCTASAEAPKASPTSEGPRTPGLKSSSASRIPKRRTDAAHAKARVRRPSEPPINEPASGTTSAASIDAAAMALATAVASPTAKARSRRRASRLVTRPPGNAIRTRIRTLMRGRWAACCGATGHHAPWRWRARPLSRSRRAVARTRRWHPPRDPGPSRAQPAWNR